MHALYICSTKQSCKSDIFLFIVLQPFSTVEDDCLYFKEIT